MAELKILWRYFLLRSIYADKHYVNRPMQLNAILWTALWIAFFFFFFFFFYGSLNFFLIYSPDINCFVLVRTASVLTSTTIYVLSKNKKNDIYPCKSKFSLFKTELCSLVYPWSGLIKDTFGHVMTCVCVCVCVCVCFPIQIILISFSCVY